MYSKSTRALLVIVAVFVMSAVAVASASATKPEFKPVPAKKKFKSTSGSVVWKSQVELIECSKSATTGEITGATTLGKVVEKMTGCTSSDNGGGTKCSVNSESAAPGEIVTDSMKGELGTVKATEAASEVGLLLTREGKKQFTLLEANGCTGEMQFTASLVGEVTPTKKKQTTGKLVIKPEIKTITLDSGETAATRFEEGTKSWELIQTDETTFEEALEVT
jgi:hypothetical protein